MYVMFPCRNGLVIEGYAAVCGYSGEDQDRARDEVLRACPEATGTARHFLGDEADIVPGSVAGEVLDIEVPRGGWPAPGPRQPPTPDSRW